MGRRRMMNWITRVFLAILLTVAVAAFTGCENALQTYVFSKLFGTGWRIESWEGPEKVLPSEDYTTLSNGFPQQIGISSDGKIHVVLYGVSPGTWLYTVKEPGASSFQEPHGEVETGIYTLAPPSMVLVLNDLPVIAYADRNSLAGDYNLCYQEKQSGGLSDWGSQRILYTHATRIEQVLMFFLTSDSLKPHFFYMADDKVYHTQKTGTSTIVPDPPEEYINTAPKASVFQLGTDDVGFVYSTTTQSLSFKRFRDNTPEVIWSTNDPDVEIASVSAIADSNGKIHVVVGTHNPADTMNPLYFTFRYLSNTGGSWSEKGTIDGSAASGPMVSYGAALALTQDREEEEHLHMVYTVLEPPLTFFAWYAYFDEGSWQVAPQSLDESRDAILPSLRSDEAGCLHVLYSDYISENERELYYVKGVPEKPQEE
jgi:hypothetical protein